MSHDDGFGIADMDVGLLNDAKVHQLIRATRDEGLVARCLIGYTAVLLASWQQGYRVPLEDAAPIWLTDLDDLAERLCAVRLLDADHLIPMNAWAGWFGPAYERREAKRAGGRRGGLAAHGLDPDTPPESGHSSGIAQGKPDPSVPSVPFVPTYPSVPSKNARANLRTNGTAIVPTEGPCRICGGHVQELRRNGVPASVPGWIEHPEHPDDWGRAS